MLIPMMDLPDMEGTNGDGPGDPDGTRRRIRSHVLIASAFGLAMGLTFMLFFLIFHSYRTPLATGITFFNSLWPNIFLSFLYGLIFGTFIAFVYNGLVAHHFNIFTVDAEDYA